MLSFLANRVRVDPLSNVDQFIMAYGGLRGAIAFSLVTLLDENTFPNKRLFLTTTIVVVYFTVFVQVSVYGDHCHHHCVTLFFLWFPLCRGEAGLVVTAEYGHFRNLLPSVPVVGLFSQFVFPLWALPFSDLSSHNPPILAVVFLVFCNHRASLTRIFLVVYHLSFGPCVQPISSGY